MKPRPTVVPTWLALDELHGLWGGTAVDVAHDGTVTVITRPRGGDYEVTRRPLSPDERSTLASVLATHDPCAIEIARRHGVPDEASSVLT